MVYAANDVAIIRSFRIFDRWGELVHERYNFPANSYSDGWDGRFNQKKLPPGVYVYIAEIQRINAKIEIVKGDVSLIR